MGHELSRTHLATAVVLVALAGGGLALALGGPALPGTTSPGSGVGPAPGGDVASLDQFGNATAFQAYLERGEAASRAGPGVFRVTDGAGSVGDGPVEFQGEDDVTLSGDGDAGAPRVEEDAPDRAREPPASTATPQATPAPAEDTPASGDDAGGGDDRVAETNVQVGGLDEPDRVKTDGSHFYYAPDGHARPVPRPVLEDDVARRPPTREPPGTHVVDIDEAADPQDVAEIDARGDLLRTGDRLVLLGDDRLTAYDVSDPAEPSEAWSRPLEDPIVTARERNGTIYLVTRSRVRPGTPCPIEPLGGDAAVPCGDIYRPGTQLEADETYTAFTIDAAGGDVHDSVSFVGTGDHTAVYMSTESLYVTYTSETDESEFMERFLTEEFDRTPDHVTERIEELRSYDISSDSMHREVTRALENWYDALDDDERREVREQLREEFGEYLADRQRERQRTGVVRVAVDGRDLAVAATGELPGRPLNQFSLSEHGGTLRIATTVPRSGAADSENDLYVLDADSLDELGRETGMGEGQEVYAVRYVDDTAYVVTFRQVDPLHVVDLSDPSNPTERGELELPGFSTYLHPIDGDHILGIGEEDRKVKTVLFDVSDPTDPTIADDHVFDDRWSAVADSHHAFTIDPRHGAFFLPAGDAAHVVDYQNGTLSIEHTVETDAPAQRTRYVEDYLYVFAGTEIAVLDQSDWERETTLDLTAGD